jgi:DNA (cytosine-5)-methyltransferase 1
LFSGCGGLDLGFVQEDFEIVWANDNDHWSCETYKRNFGNHITESSVADIDFKNTPDCDLITGGFPCQDFQGLGNVADHQQIGVISINTLCAQ